MKILFVSSFTRSSDFDNRNVILFKIKVFGRNMKETAPAKYFIKVTVHPSFTRLRVIRRINGVHSISKWKIFKKDSIVSSSYQNFPAKTNI